MKNKIATLKRQLRKLYLEIGQPNKISVSDSEYEFDKTMNLICQTLTALTPEFGEKYREEFVNYVYTGKK